MLYDHVIALTKQAGFEPHVSYAGRQLNIILSMITKGVGISIVMEKSVDLPNNGLIIKRPIDISENSQMLFMRNYNVRYPKAVELFWDFAKNNIKI